MDCLQSSGFRVLTSGCLLGRAVRYDGQAKGLEDPRLAAWQQQGWLLPVCPEVEGGLPIPRPAAERQGEGRILTASGEDVSGAFYRGARLALALCQRYGLTLALLKANSPSCGNRRIYSGRFDGTLVTGEGVTAALLAQHGVQVFNETQLDALTAALDRTPLGPPAG
ncbi:DUF523 domain-containing protein [Ferrimonas balearica]|uniref:DUF523 domain-containing protein n=1 Tax=Ferrimonas balearica TaxID=44012 RepID=UPI001C9A090C|nr:DUF523 domain-containing protein [Ferrimonas balearica]MBY5993304.1 DUF523 domain-containing protein [Ferrimonas balearica]